MTLFVTSRPTEQSFMWRKSAQSDSQRMRKHGPLLAMPSARAGRVSPRAALRRLGHAATIAIAGLVLTGCDDLGPCAHDDSGPMSPTCNWRQS